MNNRLFDEQMRAAAQKEAFTPTLEAETKLAQAMKTGAVQWASKPGKRAFSFRWVAAGLAAAAAVFALIFWQPVSDSQLGREHQMVASQPGFTPVPVTLPEVFAQAELQGETLVTKASFSNHTGDIWLIRWTESVHSNAASACVGQPKTIWLETGITYTDEEKWPGGSAFSCEYQLYRVTARMLHWLDGELLRPGQDGYEEQQSLLADAADAKALILWPGDWPEGSSGDMTLLLPDSAPQSASENEVLAYYVANGMLEPVISGTASAEVIQPAVE